MGLAGLSFLTISTLTSVAVPWVTLRGMMKKPSRFAVCLTVLSSRLCEKPACDVCSLLGPRGKRLRILHEFLLTQTICVRSRAWILNLLPLALLSESSWLMFFGLVFLSLTPAFGTVNHEDIMGWVVNIKYCRETDTRDTDTHHIWIMTTLVAESAKLTYIDALNVGTLIKFAPFRANLKGEVQVWMRCVEKKKKVKGRWLQLWKSLSSSRHRAGGRSDLNFNRMEPIPRGVNIQ